MIPAAMQMHFQQSMLIVKSHQVLSRNARSVQVFSIAIKPARDQIGPSTRKFAQRLQLNVIPISSNSSEQCAYCRKASFSLKRCTKCEFTQYCSQDCWQKHWPQHEACCSNETLQLLSSCAFCGSWTTLIKETSCLLKVWQSEVLQEGVPNQILEGTHNSVC